MLSVGRIKGRIIIIAARRISSPRSKRTTVNNFSLKGLKCILISQAGGRVISVNVVSKKVSDLKITVIRKYLIAFIHV
jgi:hypothetical protein